MKNSILAREIEFRKVFESANLECPYQIIADEQWHRCDVEGDSRGKGDGTYIVDREFQFGSVCNYKEGEHRVSWHFKEGWDSDCIDKKEYWARKKKQHEIMLEDKRQRQEQAANQAHVIYSKSSKDLSEHPYLIKKGILESGCLSNIRLVTNRLKAGTKELVIPIRSHARELTSLQFIDEQGNKLFMPKGKVQGSYFSIPGGDERIFICEGVATGISVHEASRARTYIAFSCGNLAGVGMVAQHFYPESEIIFCADDDYKTKGNPGITHAEIAARFVNGKIAIPKFKDPANRGTDFNDLHIVDGLEAVQKQISNPMERRECLLLLQTLAMPLMPAQGQQES